MAPSLSRLHGYTHSDTPHSVALLWTNEQPDPQTSTWQPTTLIRDRCPCPQRDSNPHSQQANHCRPTPQTARPLGSDKKNCNDNFFIRTFKQQAIFISIWPNWKAETVCHTNHAHVGVIHNPHASETEYWTRFSSDNSGDMEKGQQGACVNPSLLLLHMWTLPMSHLQITNIQ
jgi:hypothetical protein